MVYQLLLKWEDSASGETTLGVLARALHTCGMNAALQQLIALCLPKDETVDKNPHWKRTTLSSIRRSAFHLSRTEPGETFFKRNTRFCRWVVSRTNRGNLKKNVDETLEPVLVRTSFLDRKCCWLVGIRFEPMKSLEPYFFYYIDSNGIVNIVNRHSIGGTHRPSI